MVELNTEMFIRASDMRPRVRQKEFAKTVLTHINRVLHSEFECYGESFGSCVNGFETKASDLDVVVNLPSTTQQRLQISGCSVEAAACRELQNHLSKMEGVTRVETRESARIPVVKAMCSETGDTVRTVGGYEIEFDVSFNNTLGPRNSQLLATYCDVDPRLSLLGLIVKDWAKRREICDASKGYLSSYAWMLLVIFYLQARDPRVLPNLQQPPTWVRQNPYPTRVTRTCGSVHNTWFYVPKVVPDTELTEEPDSTNDSYVQIIPGRWTNRTATAFGCEDNASTIAELLIGFFKFYGEELDTKEYVVSIRIGRAVRKKDLFEGPEGHMLKHKELCSLNEIPEGIHSPFHEYRGRPRKLKDTISVEDPFENARILTAGVSQNNDILTEIKNAYEILRSSGSFDDLLAAPMRMC